MGRCAILHDENDADPESEHETMQPSSIFLSHTTPQQVTTTSPFGIFIVNQLWSINRKLDCMDRSHTDIKRRLSRIEHQSAVIYEMAAEQRAIYCLRSIGMTSIDGLSSEFYHMHEYREALFGLAHELSRTYSHRWACYNRYVDISLRPQMIEINLMGT